MTNPQMITIAGQIGSGKTEVSKILGLRTSREVISTGVILRRMAAEYGMTVLQFNDFAAGNPDIDKQIDMHLKALYEQPRPAIVDARLGWYFIPSSFKVYLVVDPITAAERVFGAIRPDEKYSSINAAAVEILARQKYENDRFLNLYSIQCNDWYNYDLVADTSDATPNQIADLVLKTQLQQQLGREKKTVCWLSPKRLIPTQDIRELAGTRASGIYDAVCRQGFDEGESIDIGVYQGSFLIVDGHLRASAALRTAMPFVPCNLRAIENGRVVADIDIDKFSLTSTSLSWIYDWEDAHKFRLRSYPKWLSASS